MEESDTQDDEETKEERSDPLFGKKRVLKEQKNETANNLIENLVRTSKFKNHTVDYCLTEPLTTELKDLPTDQD